MCVSNDPLACVDLNKAVLLVLIDLSAAFDIVDHEVLLDCMSKRFGIQNACLSDRSQTVQFDGCVCKIV